MKDFAKVKILDLPYHADKEFTYYIPESLKNEVAEGAFVTVPFGGGSRRVPALVTALCDTCEYKGVKPILAVSEDRFSLSEEQLSICRFLEQTTLCTTGEATRTLLPAAAFSKVEEFLTVGDRSPESLKPEEEAVYGYISLLHRVATKKLLSEYGDGILPHITRLCRKGVLRRDYEIKDPTNELYDKRIYLSIPQDEALLASKGEGKYALRGTKQRDILLNIIENEGKTKEEILSLGGTAAQLKSLIEKGIVREEREEKFRNPYKEIKKTNEKNILSDKQREVFLGIEKLINSGSPQAALLFGVTGSGKTRVMKAAIDAVIKTGRTVIILVPEISLTPQTVSVFCSFYGDEVCVMHSALSQGERFDAYKRAAAGEVKIVIGTRSAVFAPIKDLGMIIIDEEQEHSYKSDTDPKYHARDIARFRCAKNNALLLLASATPSLESYYKAEEGIYHLFTLKERYGGAKLPKVYISDMRDELRAAHTSPLSRDLIKRLYETKEKGEQAMILLNRRGYNSFLLCSECGETVTCPSCSVSLTLHRDEYGQVLKCHYCGYRAAPPKKCPSCQSDKLTYKGCGTQKAEEDISLYIPKAKTLRMDRDTTVSKESYDKMLSSFRRQEADILLGTQMIAKGHDFPLVTLVGVLNADSALSLGDYRANERTFSLITQVVGRAGRAEKNGVAVIETMKPDNEALLLAAEGDYEKFYRSEIELRKALVFPPFCDIVLLTLTARDEHGAAKGAERLSSLFSQLMNEEYKDIPVTAYGPFEAPIYKLSSKYRMRMVIKCKLSSKTRALFSRLLCLFGEGASSLGVTLSCDMNPSTV